MQEIENVRCFDALSYFFELAKEKTMSSTKQALFCYNITYFFHLSFLFHPKGVSKRNRKNTVYWLAFNIKLLIKMKQKRSYVRGVLDDLY